MKRLIIAILTLVGMVGCEYNYAIDQEDFEPRVVVNCILTPDSTITAKILWTRPYNDPEPYKMVEGFSATITQNGTAILSGDYTNGVIHSDLRPTAGSDYGIEITVPNYGTVTAKTTIPLPPVATIQYKGALGDTNVYYKNYRHFEVTSITPQTPTRSIIVRTTGLYQADSIAPYKCDFYYISNQFCDQFNAVNDGYDASLKGSSVCFDHYIRTPVANLQSALPLRFSVMGIEEHSVEVFDGYYPNTDWPKYKYLKIGIDAVVEVIAPSDDYDKYYKSAYQQTILGSTDLPIFNNTYPVHSNIQNGTGIFAGYSASSLRVKMTEDER